MNKKLISVVIPAYNEQDNVDELAKQLTAVFAENSAYDFEAIIVENGSQDNTYEKLCAVHEKDPRFKIVQLARNFRMDGGITAGLNYASGDAAVIMTADLQDPPHLITQFIKKWEEGYENVYGIVTKRNGTGLIRRFNSQLFYWVANGLTNGMVPRNVSDFRLIDRKVYETINSIHERNRFIRGLFAWVGYKSIGVEHERAERFAGVSGAHTFKVIELALKGILAHSYVPLKLITILGITISVASFILLVWTIVKAIFWGVPFAGYGTIMTVMFLMFGILFTMLGIVAEYIGLIYEEVKNRPNFIVRKQVGFNN
ncbi:glycosyltransferase family 2 protein [Methylomonas fluvii]|uniref:Glycosyltransferase family 2 protein n=1 Tax=Methylomonas fluvii TaxID=1854564 RepID=A0ABR9DCS0_9GAMM|nr:glycosyltransferase family 2 protein [Methylomonas fluvii]MBD9360887.1 glycosyltransferase family 2 protein [Methylomonas fluvii]